MDKGCVIRHFQPRSVGNVTMVSVLSGLIQKARNNPDYLGAVASGYLFIAFNILLQIVLVPLYLDKLGPHRFGVLMMLLSFVNFTMVGIYGLAGSALRVLGEYAAADNSRGFAQTYGLARTLLVIYGTLLALIVIVASVVFNRQLFDAAGRDHAFDIELAIVLIAIYVVLFLEFGLNRIALLAKKRQTQANCIQILFYLVFGASVVPWLLGGGGLAGVAGSLLLSVSVSRAAAWLYGRGIGIENIPWVWSTRDVRPLLARFIGPLGIGYFLYGVLFILLQTDVLIVGWLAGGVIAGQYVLVWKIAEVIVLMLWRVPEHLQAEFIAMDAHGDRERLMRVYRHSLWLVRFTALAAGAGYAALGPWMVRLWVGADHAPTDRWAYALAGTAIFWLATARMPAVLAFSLMRLKPLLRVAAVEIVGKLTLMFALFPMIGYLAPLVAINAVHVGGVAIAYARLSRWVSSSPKSETVLGA
jgi:O-antigen/teichoic acid export membrane protein